MESSAVFSTMDGLAVGAAFATGLAGAVVLGAAAFTGGVEALGAVLV